MDRRIRQSRGNKHSGMRATDDDNTKALHCGIHGGTYGIGNQDQHGRAFDNIFTERLWRSVKYECIYLNGYETVPELSEGLGKWFLFYNEKRPHSSLGGDRTPHEAYFGKA